MTRHAPRISLLLDEWRLRLEWIPTLSAEEVVGMPRRAESDNDLAFNGRFAVFAAWREVFVVVEMAVEACCLVPAVVVSELFLVC